MEKKPIKNSIILEQLIDLIYWPFWWYTRGLLKVILYVGEQIVLQYQYLGLGVWIKNIFTPMYGMYDWESRLISFLVRVAQIIVRLFLLLAWAFILVMVIFAWVLLPLFVIYRIYLIIANY